MRTRAQEPWLLNAAACVGSRPTPLCHDAGRRRRAMCFCEPAIVPRVRVAGTRVRERAGVHPNA
jgi:hypothetical protein